MALLTLPPKIGSPVIDSGNLLAFLQAQGVTINGDTVIANTDGSVTIDAEGDPFAAWDAYEMPEPPPTPPTLREQLVADLDAISTIAGLKTYIAETLIPATVPE